METVSFRLRSRAISTTALRIREIRVARAAPATPWWNTKMSTAFPAMLTAFAAAATAMGGAERPSARNTAAAVCWAAKKG